MSDLVHRLRLIVAEPAAWCKTDVEYVEDAADEIELLRSTVTDCRIEIARLTAERDRQTEIIITLRQELKEAKARNTMYLSKIQEFEAREY
jgi:predicted RNase H-like nuclease (RuvC/YqgF family)